MKEMKTYSMRMPDHLIERLEKRVDKHWGQSRSSRLIQDLENYYSLLDYGLKGAKRKLDKKQAQAILDVLNGIAIMPGDIAHWAGELISGRGDVRSYLAHELADGCDLNGLHEKWELDRDQLLQTIDSLSPLEHAAIIDWAKHMWAHYQDNNYWEQQISQFKNLEENV